MRDFSAGVMFRRWSAEIVLSMAGQPQRFNAMLNGITGISDRVLSQRLRELEDAGYVHREVLVGPPVRVFYGLTSDGARLLPALGQLRAVLISAPEAQEVATA